MEAVTLLFSHCLGYSLEESDCVNLVRTHVFYSDLSKLQQ